MLLNVFVQTTLSSQGRGEPGGEGVESDTTVRLLSGEFWTNGGTGSAGSCAFSPSSVRKLSFSNFREYKRIRLSLPAQRAQASAAVTLRFTSGGSRR